MRREVLAAWLFIAVLMLTLTLPWSAVANETCEIAGSAHTNVTARTPEDLVQIGCKAAEDGRLQPSSQSLLGQCGVGAKAGLDLFVDELASLATGIKDGASAGFEKAKSYIKSLWVSGSEDPAVAAEQAASANARESKSWLSTVSKHVQASQLLVAEYFKELDVLARFVGTSMMCLPWKFKLELACQFLSQVALEAATIKGVSAATDKTAAAAKAAREFIARTNAVEGMKGLSFSERLKAGASALEASQQYRLEAKLGEAGNLRSRVDPITNQETLHFEEIARVKVETSGGAPTMEKRSVMRDVFRDAKTLAIDANSETGKKVAKLMTEQSKGKYMIFADVNNLGKVNYFKNGTQAGDEYLARIGENIRKNLRPSDRFFKNGGDELVILLDTENKESAKQVMQKIHASIENDEALQALFKRERIAVAEKIRAENASAGSGGNTFKALSVPTPEQVKALQATAQVRPSLSMGSARIHGDWAVDLERAEKQAGMVKERYKRALGSDASKYSSNFEVMESTNPRFIAKPEVFDPVD